MKRLVLFLIGLSVFSSGGCSIMIAGSGVDPCTLKTKEEVHKQFGKPRSSGEICGIHFENYRTRQKLTHALRQHCAAFGFVMTYGLVEFYAFPHELYLLGRNTLFGQDLRFKYDSDGKVIGLVIDPDLP